MTSHYPVSNPQIDQARADFFERGILPLDVVPPPIIRSWQRSIEHGIGAGTPPRTLPTLSSRELERLTGKNRQLLQQSIPVMENLYEQVQGTSCMVILADASGVVLHSVGDPHFVNRAQQVALHPGGIWSEQYRGTNAIGTALMEQHPVVVHSAEHCDSSNDFLSCAAVPIFDPYGKLLGVLDVSGDYRAYQQHTMALVGISVQQIENQMFTVGFEADITLQFHRRPEFIGTMYEAIAVFSTTGMLVAANRCALLHLGLDRYRLPSTTFDSLFGADLEPLLAGSPSGLQPMHRMRLRNGMEIFGRVRYQQSRVSTAAPTPRKATATEVCFDADNRPASLNALEFGDYRMRTAIEKVRKVVRHDIPIIIQGESGTGKELFARAIHLCSPRRSGPFIAINCAAIPESLIESELFGYQEGAFTGAHRKGNAGKIRQADGGTLFLDEIGDMPLALQARLLRVLQERTITPLGSTRSHRVDIAVVCATNRNLRSEIAEGRFREDLYYRLNGLLVSLPRLKDRDDLLPLASSLLAEIAGPARNVSLHESVVAMFRRHPWPGNVRQLSNVLRTAVALLGDAEIISAELLPEDFLDQLHEQDTIATPLPTTPPNSLQTGRSERLDLLESQAIRRAVAESGGNISAAARRLGISRNTLYRKMRSFGL